MLTTIQEIYCDLCDLIENNEEALAHIPIEGFSEFDTLGEFLEEQKTKISWLEDELAE